MIELPRTLEVEEYKARVRAAYEASRDIQHWARNQPANIVHARAEEAMAALENLRKKGEELGMPSLHVYVAQQTLASLTLPRDLPAAYMIR